MGDGLLHRVAALAALAAALAAPLACGGGGSELATVEDESRWVVADPAAEGFDAAALARADRYAARSVPSLTSLLVVRHGRLVFERYYREAARDDRNHVFSVTKSVVAALVGIALRDGELRSVDQHLGEFVDLPAGADPTWRLVTLRDLLTMTSGLAPQGAIPYFATSDWVEAILLQPFVREPSTAFAYDDRGPHLLSAVLSRATGSSAAELARRELFEPLGIGPGWVWSADPQGISAGGAGLHLAPRDLAKLGVLFLREGRWGDEQLVPADFVRDATKQQVAVGPPGGGYGYLWWTNEAADPLPASFVAVGAGGQIVAVYPSLDLVVVTTSAAGDAPFDRFEELIERRVLPAVRD